MKNDTSVSKEEIKWWKDRGFSPSLSVSLKPSTSIFPVKKKTKTKVKNGGKTKSVMVKNQLYNASTTSTLPHYEKYPYTFIPYKATWFDRFVDKIKELIKW